MNCFGRFRDSGLRPKSGSFPPERWQLWPGMGGNFQAEWWQFCSGICRESNEVYFGMSRPLSLSVIVRDHCLAVKVN